MKDGEVQQYAGLGKRISRKWDVTRRAGHTVMLDPPQQMQHPIQEFLQTTIA